MKIAFFSENNYNGTVPRHFPNMRTEFSWMCALDATHYPINKIHEITDHYDLGIIILPKKNINAVVSNPQMPLIENMRKVCDKIAAMQEGPHWFWQDYEMADQIGFYNTLTEMDILFAHNLADKKYFEGLVDDKACFIIPSLMIEDTIGGPHEKEDKTIIGGNMCSWYSGMDSYMIATEFKTPISVPSMGRKIEGEDQLDNLTHLHYMNWSQWIQELSRYKYAVHLMRTHAAGTFALNCAYWGIPCIGYKELDTQRTCHTALSVDTGDLTRAKELAKRLEEDASFYKKCSSAAIANYKTHYTEEKFKEYWRGFEEVFNKYFYS